MKRCLCAAVVLVTALLGLSASSAAFEIEPRSGTGVTGELIGIPPRFEGTIKPGQSRTYRVGFQNRRGKPVRFQVVTRDVGSRRSEPGEMFALSEAGPFGAREWMTPDKDSFELQHGDIGWVDVKVAAPEDASPGSYYAAVVAYADPEELAGGSDRGSATVQAGVGVQIFLTVPGTKVQTGEVEAEETPRLVWRDRSTRIPVDVRYENTGNVTDVVGGSLSLKSPFGRRVGSSRVARQYVLRGGVREYRFLWSDPPWIGRFTPRVELVGESRQPKVVELDPVWILPSWKYLVVVLAALVLPFAVRWWRRRRAARIADWDDDEDLDEFADDDFGDEGDEIAGDDWELDLENPDQDVDS